MSQVNSIFAGFAAQVYIQPAVTPVPLTIIQLGANDLDSATESGTEIKAIVTASNILQVQQVGIAGYENAEVSFPLAGSRYGMKLATQSPPASLTWTLAYNPSNPAIQLLASDANRGTVIRTYVLAALVGLNTTVYAFNATASAAQINYNTAEEAKYIVTVVPVGGGVFGYSFISSAAP